MSIFIFFLDVPYGRCKQCCVRLPSLHQVEIGITQNEPFCAGAFEIDFDASMSTLALAVEYDTIAELLVMHALAKTNTELAARRRRSLPAARRTARVNRARDLNARPYFLDMLIRYFGNKARWLGEIIHAVQASLFRVGDIKRLLGTCYSHVAKTTLFFQPIRVGNRALMREQAVLHAAQEYQRKLEALGRVHGHQLHAVFPGIRLPFARLKGGMGQELIEGRHLFGRVGLETPGGADEFEQVLDTRFAFLALVLFEEIDKAALVDNVVYLVMEIEPPGFPRQAFDQRHESVDRIRRAAVEVV